MGISLFIRVEWSTATLDLQVLVSDELVIHSGDHKAIGRARPSGCRHAAADNWQRLYLLRSSCTKVQYELIDGNLLAGVASVHNKRQTGWYHQAGLSGVRRVTPGYRDRIGYYWAGPGIYPRAPSQS